MNKELKKKILELRKQKIHCDECGKEIYKPYILGTGVYCHACYQKKAKNYVSPNQLKFKFFEV